MADLSTRVYWIYSRSGSKMANPSPRVYWINGGPYQAARWWTPVPVYVG